MKPHQFRPGKHLPTNTLNVYIAAQSKIQQHLPLCTPEKDPNVMLLCPNNLPKFCYLDKGCSRLSASKDIFLEIHTWKQARWYLLTLSTTAHSAVHSICWNYHLLLFNDRPVIWADLICSHLGRRRGFCSHCNACSPSWWDLSAFPPALPTVRLTELCGCSKNKGNQALFYWQEDAACYCFKKIRQPMANPVLPFCWCTYSWCNTIKGISDISFWLG